jgi:cyd operon protein YbgT
MWYFAWILGTALAISFGILNALWHEVRVDESCGNDCENCKCE